MTRDWDAKWRLVGSYLNDEEYDEHCFGDRPVTSNGRALASGSSIKVESLDEILWRMEPGSYQTRCPIHDDEAPSLGLLITPEKRIIVNCLAGCDWKQIQDYVKARL